MKSVLSLIGNPQTAPLVPAALEAAAGALAQQGLATAPPDILAPAIAADIPVEGDLLAALPALRAGLAPWGLDINALPAAGRRKRLLVADMDSTIITCECIDELADAVGLKARIAAITERAMRGELPFEPALRERVALLRGLTEETLEKVYRDRVRLMPGARTLVQTMRRAGAHTVLVSGGFTFFTARVAAAAGFHEARANRLLMADGRLTGAVAEPVLGRAAKRETLESTARMEGIPLDAALAVGDGANDLAMIEAAGLGVAYHAKPLVAEAARARIDHADLTALLYLQGYRASELVID